MVETPIISDQNLVFYPVVDVKSSFALCFMFILCVTDPIVLVLVQVSLLIVK